MVLNKGRLQGDCGRQNGSVPFGYHPQRVIAV